MFSFLLCYAFTISKFWFFKMKVYKRNEVFEKILFFHVCRNEIWAQCEWYDRQWFRKQKKILNRNFDATWNTYAWMNSFFFFTNDLIRRIVRILILVNRRTNANSKRWLLFFLTNVKRNNETLLNDVIFTNQTQYFTHLKSLIFSLILMMTRNSFWSFFDSKLFTIQYSTKIADVERIEKLSIFWQVHSTLEKSMMLFEYFNIDENDERKIISHFVSSWFRFNILDHFLVNFYREYEVFLCVLCY